jgi:hypothetical protein
VNAEPSIPHSFEKRLNESRLANPRFAGNQHYLSFPGQGFLEQAVQGCQFSLSSDKNTSEVPGVRG